MTSISKPSLVFV